MKSNHFIWVESCFKQCDVCCLCGLKFSGHTTGPVHALPRANCTRCCSMRSRNCQMLPEIELGLWLACSTRSSVMQSCKLANRQTQNQWHVVYAHGCGARAVIFLSCVNANVQKRVLLQRWFWQAAGNQCHTCLRN